MDVSALFGKKIYTNMLRSVHKLDKQAKLNSEDLKQLKEILNLGDKDTDIYKIIINAPECDDIDSFRKVLDTLTEEIKNFLNQDPEHIAVITDIRYAEYEEDELFWLKKQLDGHLIHITMSLDNNEKLKAPNKEEEQNDPILKKHADYRVIWNKVEPFSFKNLNLLTHAEKIEKFIRS